MKKVFVWFMVCGLAFGVTSARAEEGGHRIGGGVNYWVAIDDISSNLDDNGLSYLASYQYRGGLLGLQVDFEYLADLFADDAYAPAAYGLVSLGAFYGALGAGFLNYDGEWANDPFFAIKGGLDLELLPSIYLDIGASYRFGNEVTVRDALDDISADTLFLGAAVRLDI